MSVPGWESERTVSSTPSPPPPTPKNSNPIYRFLDRIFCLCDGRTNISSTRREEDTNWITNSIIVLHCSQNKFAAQIGFIDSIRRLRIGRMKLVTPSSLSSQTPIPLFTFRSIIRRPSASPTFPPLQMRNQIRPLGPGDSVAGGPPLANLSSLSVKPLSDACS